MLYIHECWYLLRCLLWPLSLFYHERAIWRVKPNKKNKQTNKQTQTTKENISKEFCLVVYDNTAFGKAKEECGRGVYPPSTPLHSLFYSSPERYLFQNKPNEAFCSFLLVIMLFFHRERGRITFFFLPRKMAWPHGTFDV